jgi:hypothetical protein
MPNCLTVHLAHSQEMAQRTKAIGWRHAWPSVCGFSSALPQIAILYR